MNISEEQLEEMLQAAFIAGDDYARSGKDFHRTRYARAGQYAASHAMYAASAGVEAEMVRLATVAATLDAAKRVIKEHEPALRYLAEK